MKLAYIFIIGFLLFSCSEATESPISAYEHDNKTSSESQESSPSIENISEGDQAATAEEKVNMDTKGFVSKPKSETIKNGSTKPSEISTAKQDDAGPATTVMVKEDFSDVYNQILNNFVSSSGKVNYASIKTNKEMLGQAIQYFEENTPQSSWSKNQKLAYWINAYNLYTMKLVVDNYPVSSIKDIANGKPWDKKFIQLDGKTLSLNDIENGIIRKDFNEPRIHFAVNCASISCPKLLNKAYTSSNLNSLLESQTKNFINDNSMNKIGSSSIEISNIFDWYKADFIKTGTVIDFLNEYSSTKIEDNAKTSYKEYNWNLNK